MQKYKYWGRSYEMSEEIRVLIADDNIEFGDILNNHISLQPDMKVVGLARDGQEAVDMLESVEPDIILLDIIMPNLDGIGVLERISEMKPGSRPAVIMLTAIGQEIFIQKAILLGADYYVVKPFDINVLISRVRHVHKEKASVLFSNANFQSVATPVQERTLTAPSYNLELEVTNLMREVGIPPHMIGYQYIREAILLSINNSRSFTAVTKVLYPAVAEKFDTTPQKVERAIRNAIEGAWERSSGDSLDALFGYATNPKKPRPTNSEFIAMVADKIRLKLGLEKKA
jgi:two-component system, response regulator, stage 0 sporulation protein A